MNGEQEMAKMKAYELDEALNGIVGALHRLGLNQASTPMGAIELLAMEIRDGFEKLAAAIQLEVWRGGGSALRMMEFDDHGHHYHADMGNERDESNHR